jgi:hypothetical protein
MHSSPTSPSSPCAYTCSLASLVSNPPSSYPSLTPVEHNAKGVVKMSLKDSVLIPRRTLVYDLTTKGHLNAALYGAQSESCVLGPQAQRRAGSLPLGSAPITYCRSLKLEITNWGLRLVPATDDELEAQRQFLMMGMAPGNTWR